MADGAASITQASHRRHDPRDAALGSVVREEDAAFLESTRRRGAPLPRYVEDVLHAYLRCGVLACGFARARCAGCGADKLVAFSRKKRWLCPSC